MFLNVKGFGRTVWAAHEYDKDKRNLFQVAVASELQVHLEQVPFCVSDVLNCSAFSTQQLWQHMCVSEGEWTVRWKQEIKNPSIHLLIPHQGHGGRWGLLSAPMQVRAFITLEETNVLRSYSPMLERRFHRSSVQSSCMATGT